jgi:D-alanyl-D-alanine endopeptidase (penicillin-binding protein 7)
MLVILAVLCSLGSFDPALRNATANPSPPPNIGPLTPYLNPKKLFLRSDVALIVDGREGYVLFEKNMHTRRPIASLTKLMTAMVTLDAQLSLDEMITITKADRDRMRGSASKLSFGTKLTRRDLLEIALAASENRAATALGRTYPGGMQAMVAAMNSKARQLGMKHTSFRDPAGLHHGNISTAADLSILVNSAYRYPLIRELTTVRTDFVTDRRTGWKIKFVNTNRLVRSRQWTIDLSKTGYIADAGHCLVMRAEIADRPVNVVLLNSWGEFSKYGDANRIRKWLDHAARKAEKTARTADAG